MSTYPSLYLLFTIVYAGGVLSRLGLPDFWSKILVELSVGILVCSVLRLPRKQIAPGWPFVLVFIVCTILSGIMSGDGLFLSLLYFRMSAYTYLVFWAVWNARLTADEIFRLNRFVLGLWILQIAASAFHVFILGERVEAHVGTLTAGAGSPATVFPLFALVYVLAFYCYYKRSMWLLLIGMGFTLVGYSSGKRAIYFYIPIVYSLVFLWYAWRGRSFVRLSTFLVPIAVFVLCIPALIFGLTQSKRFTHLEGEGGWTLITESIDVAEEYDSRVLAGGKVFGRTANSKALLGRLFSDNWDRYLLGLGPASMKNIGSDRGKSTEDIVYGAVGWVENTISVGWPAMLAYIGFYFVLWLRLYRRRRFIFNNYAKALHFGCHLGFSVFFVMYFTYTYAYAMAGWLTFVQVYFVAILLSPRHQGLLQTGMVVGAKVHGNVGIFNNLKIAPNAIEINAVPPNSTAVGLPAKVVYK